MQTLPSSSVHLFPVQWFWVLAPILLSSSLRASSYSFPGGWVYKPGFIPGSSQLNPFPKLSLSLTLLDIFFFFKESLFLPLEFLKTKILNTELNYWWLDWDGRNFRVHLKELPFHGGVGTESRWPASCSPDPGPWFLRALLPTATSLLLVGSWLSG